jgi:hypothetical protein
VPNCLSVLRFAPAIKIIGRTIGKILNRFYASSKATSIWVVTEYAAIRRPRRSSIHFIRSGGGLRPACCPPRGRPKKFSDLSRGRGGRHIYQKPPSIMRVAATLKKSRSVPARRFFARVSNRRQRFHRF